MDSSKPPRSIHSHNISLQSDLAIRIYYQIAPTDVSTDNYTEEYDEHVFYVKKETIIKYDYFKALLTGPLKKMRESSVELRGDHPDAMLIWFTILEAGAWSPDEKNTNMNIDISWHVLAAGHKYGLDPQLVSGWSELWHIRSGRNRNDAPSHQKLLFPCYTYDHIHGFAASTRFLAYNAGGHITEVKPIEDFHLHLPPRIIRKLSMKTIPPTVHYQHSLVATVVKQFTVSTQSN